MQDRLQESLPGASAHDLMKPVMPGDGTIQTKNNDSRRKGGVMILLFEKDGLVRFPLIQRPVYNGVHSGQVALPGGKKEETDTDLIITAKRESEEEIGVDMGSIHVVGSLSRFFVAASNYDVLPVVGYVKEPPVFIPDEREVSEIITPQVIDLIANEKRQRKNMEVRRGVTLDTPYFDLQQKVVWGATAMMLSEFASIISEFEAF